MRQTGGFSHFSASVPVGTPVFGTFRRTLRLRSPGLRPPHGTLISLSMRSSAFLSCAVFAATVSAQGVDYIRSHYTKYEYQIPMRDGVRLFTAVYVPKDT